MEILVINFSLDGMTEAEYRTMCDEVAPAFAAVSGLVSKVWLADRANGVYGGVYTFENGDALDAYLDTDFGAGRRDPGLGRCVDPPLRRAGGADGDHAWPGARDRVVTQWCPWSSIGGFLRRGA